MKWVLERAQVKIQAAVRVEGGPTEIVTFLLREPEHERAIIDAIGEHLLLREEDVDATKTK